MEDDRAELAALDEAVENYEAARTVVSRSSGAIETGHQIVRFRGRAMLMVRHPFPHYVPLHKERFEQIAYPILGGVSRSRINDVFSYLCNAVPDLTPNENLVLFGIPLDMVNVEAGTDLTYYAKYKPTAWDMDTLEPLAVGKTAAEINADDCVWRSPFARMTAAEAGKAVCDSKGRMKFIMQLAGGDTGLYDDIMQSIAPLIMTKKPDGVIWWVGAGANGKSTLMDALYKIFPGQFSSITVKRLVDGRDTPSLNGTLANIVKESSEGRVEDTEVYKAVGTHENFRVHKFHSQDDVEIRGNLHHIFSANMIPSFNDKGYAARRRTFIIPFTQTFDSDPEFEDRTFSPQFFGYLISEMCKYAVKIKKNHYKYHWSAKTRAAKLDYDAEASNAEDYAGQLLRDGVVAFDSFGPVKVDYENWCTDNGYVPLGMGNLRRAMQAVGFENRSAREQGRVAKKYLLPDYTGRELDVLGMARPGLYKLAVSEGEDWVDEAKEKVDEAAAAPKKQTTILGDDKW